MFAMVISNILVPDMAKVSGEYDKKIVAVGITNVLCGCAAMRQQYRDYAPLLLQALIQIFELPPDENPLDGEHLLPLENDDVVGYQAAYSQLSFAQQKVRDPLSHIEDGRKYLVKEISGNVQTNGDIVIYIRQMPSDHQMALQKYCAQAGVQIMGL